MRKAAAAFIMIALCIPVFSAAQSAEEIQAKIQVLLQQIKILQDKIVGTPAATGAAASAATASLGCPALSRLLAIGSRGADVTALQVFLKQKGYMSEEATGYFGALTEAAVKKLQVAQNIVSSGNAATTGFGAAGPKTRTVIASLCAGNPMSASTSAVVSASSTTPAPQCAQATSASAPSVACGGTWEKLQNMGCHIGWKCTVPSFGGNRVPVITAIDGPTSLAIDAFGSWKIAAVDPEGGVLSYSVTWGDEGIEDILKAIAGLSGSFGPSANLSHSFAKAGTYTVQFTAKDVSGATALATLVVKVTADGTISSVTTPFNPVVASTTSAAACITPWGNQVVVSGSSALWQPFFTEGTYLATTSPVMKCDNGGWRKCDTAGNSCQSYLHPTSTPSTAALPSYTTTIGGSCSPEGSTKQASVPPGTQLCQWLNCRTTTQVETITLKCTHSGWTDYAGY